MIKFKYKARVLWRMYGFMGTLVRQDKMQMWIKAHPGFSDNTLKAYDRYLTALHELQICMDEDVQAISAMDRETFEARFKDARQWETYR